MSGPRHDSETIEDLINSEELEFMPTLKEDRVAEQVLTSIAISLKRIADELDGSSQNRGGIAGSLDRIWKTMK